eukprot:435910-Pelagomonas_calceolata.AAC.1
MAPQVEHLNKKSRSPSWELRGVPARFQKGFARVYRIQKNCQGRFCKGNAHASSQTDSCAHLKAAGGL